MLRADFWQYAKRKKDILTRLADFVEKKSKEMYKSNLEFAHACNVDEKTIRRILRGEQNISIKVLKNISEALGMKASELLRALDE